MQRVTVTFADETVESLDDVAACRFGGERDVAARELLSTWLERR